MIALVLGCMLGARPRQDGIRIPRKIVHVALLVLSVDLAVGMIVSRLTIEGAWVDLSLAVVAWLLLLTCCCCVGTLTYSLRLLVGNNPTGDALQLAILSLLPIPVFVVAELLGRFFPHVG